MWQILANRTYRHLFVAQVLALVGTGLATVALGLLAYELAGANAGQVLGTALAIKMIAYVVVSPVATALLGRLPRRAVLVTFDVLRLLVALALPWVDQVWQVYLLIFLLQASSATFTPTFQATIPDVLPKEDDYTRALTLSRLAYDLETLLSPLLAAALLTVVSTSSLFYGTAGGFLASALLVLSVRLPAPREAATGTSFRSRLTRGMRLFLATPRLRGLLALSLTAAAGGALVIVNTVVIVREALDRPATSVAVALAAYGAGSMVFALLMPRLLRRRTDRAVMLAGGAIVATGLGALAMGWAALLATPLAWPALLALWAVLGAGYAALVTPSGRLLRRSSSDADRPALFAAQFSLSHACWLITYPLVGWLVARAGLNVSMGAMAVIAVLGVALAWRLWPRNDPTAVAHSHPGLPADDPHLAGHAAGGDASGVTHVHDYVIDDLHVRWPAR